MKAIVVYATHYGNTEKIAGAIATGLRRFGPVALFEVGKAPDVIPKDVELIVIGGPTEAHRSTPDVTSFLDKLVELGLDGKRAAAFDTRVRWPRALSGSAAGDITKKLHLAGAEIAAEPMSFFVAGKVAHLEPGELERAEGWAATLLTPVAAQS